MSIKWRLAILLLPLIGLTVLLTVPISAQDQTVRVGLVIKGQGGQVSTYCLTLTPDHANGLDALRATSLDISAQIGALGAAVCRIQTVGCSYPAETCFCQCQGNQCNYWSYFYQDTDRRWLYSGIGPSTRKLKTGDVDGWLWNEGKDLTPVGGLPDLSFDTICSASSAPNSPNASTNALSPSTIVGYGLFVLVVLGIAGVVLWRRIKSR